MSTLFARVLLCGGAAVALGASGTALAQALVPTGDAAQGIGGNGWRGFADVALLGQAVVALGMAAALGAAIGYHPRARQRVDTVEEIEAPKVCITYAVVGAVIGMMVVKYGMVVGFVVFGIGGLFRFRTELPSAALTGRVILVTLAGLACGLNLPYLGVMATAFGFALVYVLDARLTYSLEVESLDTGRLAEASEAYRAALEGVGGKVVRERRSASRSRVQLVFVAPSRLAREVFERALDERVPPDLQGVADWAVE